MKADGGKYHKPETIFSYTNIMSEVDFSDQYLASYSFLKKNHKMLGKAVYPPFQHDFVEQQYTT